MTPTLAGRWRQAVAARPDATFLIFEGPGETVASWSYASFDMQVSRVAAGLVRCGVDRGSAVHMALTNGPAFVAIWLAAARLGAWIVPSDPASTPPELAGHISRTKPAVGICSTARRAAYLDARPGMPVVAIDDHDTSLEALAGPSAGGAAHSEPAPRDRAAVMFTSGTTSIPKGVVITQANYAFAGDVMAAAAQLGPGDRQFVVLPLFHANAQYYSFASAISAGASVALMHSFSASRFLGQAARHEVTHASLFAAPMRMILARGANPVSGLRLRHCWYAQNVTDAQYEQLADLLGCAPRQLYGMTETIPAVLANRALHPVPSAIGEPTLGCQVDLRRPDDGGQVSDGEVGEIVVGGEPGRTLFAGYFDDPVTTASAFCDGWFLTGDLARRDHDGRYTFVGRRSDILKVAGENVSVVEVESVLAQHPSVLEAAVIGEPDPVRDEVPVGYVVQQPGAAPVTPEELIAWCNDRLAKSKRPRRIEVVTELPRTSVGKIRKFALRASTSTAAS